MAWPDCWALRACTLWPRSCSFTRSSMWRSARSLTCMSRPDVRAMPLQRSKRGHTGVAWRVRRHQHAPYPERALFGGRRALHSTARPL